MLRFQLELYSALMKLVESNDAFFFSDQELDGTTFRIFNYRLASYTNFLEEGALECRGVMFEVNEDGKFIRLAARPMEKFFNLYENPLTMDLDLSTTQCMMVKADGSLISSYIHNGELRLKSKGSLFSDQAIDSLAWLSLPENADLFDEIHRLSLSGFTVNMEWCGPHNRIVLHYEQPQLIVLNIRSNIDGQYLTVDMLNELYIVIKKYWVGYKDFVDPVGFIELIPDMVDIEGYVVQLADGTHFKVKTLWYLTLHHAKDSVNCPRRLFEAVLAEGTDDLRSLFFDDPGAIKIIEDMELFVEKKYNHLVDSVERFYERNKEMERKEYAILGQEELDRKAFGLAMSKYSGKEVNYKEFMAKNWKAYGLVDEKVIVE